MGPQQRYPFQRIINTFVAGILIYFFQGNLFKLRSIMAESAVEASKIVSLMVFSRFDRNYRNQCIALNEIYHVT